MLVTVSTAKDTLPNMQRFVTGNLAGGADHLFVFLDAPDSQVSEYLHSDPHVTCVCTDESWWRGRRPESLNARQRANANVVLSMARDFDWVDWVFHVDSDEVVWLDRSILDAVPGEIQAVNLAPREAVARKRWDGDPTWFKRLLGEEDLVLLTTLGLIPRPDNRVYFRGHTSGKSGVRPATDVWLGLHQGRRPNREKVPRFQHEACKVLHFHAYSGEEFVRQWIGLLGAGPSFLRPARRAVATSVQSLLSKDLTREQASAYLMRLFERTTEDDFDTLRELGLLEEIDLSSGTHVPQALPSGGRDQILAALERKAGRRKRFRQKRPKEGAAGTQATFRTPADTDAR